MPLTLSRQAVQSLKTASVALSPTVSESLQKLRDLLYESAARDGIDACEFSKDPAGTWYPYGQETECRIRHIRRPDSEFRKGIYWHFQHNQSTNQRALSDQIVEPLIAMIVREGEMKDAEARRIVLDDYKYVYQELPPSAQDTSDPSRSPKLVLPGDRRSPKTNGDSTVAGGGAGCEPGYKLTERGCEPCIPDDSDPQCYALQIQECELQGGQYDMATGQCMMPTPEPEAEGEFPWMWVGIGAGALLIVGGGIYYMSKKKGPG